MKRFIYGTLILALLAPFTASGEIICTTPRGSRQLVIKKISISMSTPTISSSRSVASEAHVRTRLQGNGFTKIMYSSGKKFIVHVKDQDNFSEINDYLVIRSKKGHEMTYPLTCQNK